MESLVSSKKSVRGGLPGDNMGKLFRAHQIRFLGMCIDASQAACAFSKMLSCQTSGGCSLL